MKAMKNLCLPMALAIFTANSWAQTSTPAKPTKAKAAVTAAEIQALKDAIAAQQTAIITQQQEIQQLQDELHHKDESVQQAQSAAAAAATKADAAQAQAAQQQASVVELKTDVADLKTNVNNAALSIQETQKNVAAAMVQQENPAGAELTTQATPASSDQNPMHGPISIHFKGITISPGGFAEAAFVRRSRALGADLPTPFNSLTMPGASQSTMSEFFGSARQSRPTVYVDGRLKDVELSSYVSADFLSAGVTSSSTQTDSYTLRLRQAWGQAKFDSGWSFLGGQMWSLVTENKQGIQPSDDLGRTNDARPATIDPGYNVGFSFARQYAIRLTKDIDKKWWFAVSMENAQGTLTTHGNGDNFLLGEAGASNSFNTTANYTFNPSPDVIAKIAADPGFGHYEVFGLWDRFRNRVFPCGAASATVFCNGAASPGPNAIGAYNPSKNGVGLGANARWNFDNKHVVFGLHAFGGNGIGRYGAAQLSDLSVHADGTLNLIRDYQGLATLEWHGRKLDVYGYAGAEYAGRAYSFDTNPLDTTFGKYVGYGSPHFNNSGCYTETTPTANSGFAPGTLANCTADTRAIIEGTFGFWYRFYNGPRGRFQFGTQYSYVTRQTWYGTGFSPGTGAEPEGLDGMVFSSFRYYLP